MNKERVSFEGMYIIDLVEEAKQRAANLQSSIKELDFSNAYAVAKAFGSWLNLYFHPGDPQGDTWFDVDDNELTTAEIFTEFCNDAEKNK